MKKFVKILSENLTREASGTDLPGKPFLLLTNPLSGAGRKKAHPVSQMSLNILSHKMWSNFCKLYSDLSLPAIGGIGVGTFIQLSELYGLPRLHRAKTLCLS